MSRIHSFEPLIHETSKILILGSIPGQKSLEAQAYYANPGNQFWRMIGALTGETVPEAYEGRLGFLESHRIALWDVIGSCTREGSLDSAIREALPNDFEKLFLQYPKIECVAFNGTKAFDTYRRQVKVFDSKTVYIKLPSTSPAHTTAFEKKLTEWRQLLVWMNV